MRFHTPAVGRLGLAALVAACVLATAAPVSAQTGGTEPPGSTTTTSAPTGPPGRGKILKTGEAVAPADAPPAIQAAIAAGNQIRTMPYRWGGGHQSFSSTGYDCSGAVSYVLHGAGMLSSPMPSGPLATSWGASGKGRWITVYANAGHVYMVVAGLRFDTSALGEKLSSGSGPRWRRTKRKPRGYTPKYYPGY